MELKIRNLHKKYRKKSVFSGENFSFHTGISVLLGANGIGKSTLINILSTSLDKQKGNIIFDGTDITTNLKAYRTSLGFLPQNPPHYVHFTAYQYLEYMSFLKELDAKEIPHEIERVLSIVRLLDVKDKKIKQFSGGMKQRLAIAQAFLGNPPIMIFDEPTVGLDPKERLIFKNYLKTIAQEKIIILSTHIISDAEDLADYIYMIKSGEVMFEGSIEEVIHQAKDENISTIDDIFLALYE